MFETLQVETDGGIGRLTLNRPEKLNPLSTAAARPIVKKRWLARPDGFLIRYLP